MGHAKSICLNFGLVQGEAAYPGQCNLRFDDANPEKAPNTPNPSRPTCAGWALSGPAGEMGVGLFCALYQYAGR